ncbi:MAG TPA: AraC family transcriptional regulator [Thermoanaerobaculia bacterium]|jgi:AraC family transcriptional regulator
MLALRVTDYAPRSAMAPHRHDELSMIVVVGGAYVERIRGGAAEHGPGRMLLYPAGALHSQQFGAAGARKIVFTPGAASLDYLRERGIALDAPRSIESPLVSQLARRILAELQRDDPFTSLAVEGLAMELVAAFVRVDREPAAPAPPPWLRAARDAVHDLANDDLTLESLAAQIGRHPVHLAREFRRYFGTTVGACRRQLRLERAEELLRGGEAITDVALACGFASHSHFCRAFKTAYGMTPSQFRDTLRR